MNSQYYPAHVATYDRYVYPEAKRGAAVTDRILIQPATERHVAIGDYEFTVALPVWDTQC